jgi:hypothetical protein
MKKKYFFTIVALLVLSVFSFVSCDSTATVLTDKDALDAAITAATTLNTGTAVGVTTGDVEDQADKDTFTAAIATAQAVYDNADATQAEIDAAVTDLVAAQAVFTALILTEDLPLVTLSFNGTDVYGEVGTYTAGGAISFTITDNVIAATTTAVTANSWDPKVFVALPALVDGTSYTVSFDIVSDVTKEALVKVGQQLTYDPWWSAQYEDTADFETITSTSRNISKTFTYTATEHTDFTVDLIVEMGTINGDAGTATFSISNIVLAAN